MPHCLALAETFRSDPSLELGPRGGLRCMEGVSLLGDEASYLQICSSPRDPVPSLAPEMSSSIGRATAPLPFSPEWSETVPHRLS